MCLKILITGSVKGTVSSDSSVGETTSTVHRSNLVRQLLTAKVIKADSNASTTDGAKFTYSDTGSKFVGLKVSGHPGIKDNMPPNTKVKISGLGTLWLHRVIQTDNYIEVRMVELIVTQANKFGIAWGPTSALRRLMSRWTPINGRAAHKWEPRAVAALLYFSKISFGGH